MDHALPRHHQTQPGTGSQMTGRASAGTGITSLTFTCSELTWLEPSTMLPIEGVGS